MRFLTVLILLAGCGGDPAERRSFSSDPPSNAPPASMAEGPAERESSNSAGATAEAWTIEPTTLARETDRMAMLEGVREAMHLEGGYDRVVFDLPGGLPEVHIEYVDTPVIACGSGDQIRPEGEGFLQIRLSGARAHTDDGQPTARHDRQSHEFPVLRETVPTCDFEGEVTWVLGVSSPEPYRVMRLDGPARLAVDVQHPAAE